MRRRKKLKKEEIAEDWCFSCKDGGSLMICNFKDCLKAYHPACVNKDDSQMKTKEKWTCDLHYCFECDKASKYYCLSCPSAICGPCLDEAKFVIVKGDKGLCYDCLKLALLIEEKKDVDSNGRKIDFSDPSTEEYFFCDYWRIIKEKECLTSEQVISAYTQLITGENNRFASNSDEFHIWEENKSRKRNRSKGKQSENEEDFSVACTRQLRSSSVKQSHSKEVVAYQITEAQGKEPTDKDPTGTNEQEHNVGIQESSLARNSDECQLNSSVCDDYADIEEYYPLLRWCEKREKSNGEMSVKKNEMPSEQPLQSLFEEPVVFADRQYAEPACIVYSRRNRQEYCDGLLETLLERTSNGNGISFHMPSDQPEFLNEASIGIAVAQHVEPVFMDSLRADEQDSLRESSLGRTCEGNAIPCHVNCFPDVSAAPPSRPSTAVFQSEVPEASAPLTSMIEIIDVKDETVEINLLGEGHVFFANLQPLIDESLERSSQQPSFTITLSPGEIMEAKRCLNQCCSMNFEQLIHHAERDKFLSTLDLLLKYGYFPNHMLDMITDLRLKYSSNKCLYSVCRESVRRADEERERAESLKQELTDNYSLHQEIERKIKVVDDKIEKLRNQLKDMRNLRKGLGEQSKSLKASSMTSYDALCQYKKSSETLEKSKQTGQQLMKDIDEFWDILRIDILNLFA